MKMLLTRPRAAVAPPYDCQLVEIGAELVPYLLGALYVREQRYNWLTDADAIMARRMLAKQGADLLMPCGKEIVQSVNQVYMLLNQGLNGQSYSYSGSGTDADPYVYNPSIPVVPSNVYMDPGIVAQNEDMKNLLNNAFNGVIEGNYSEPVSIRNQLQSIIDGVAEGGGLDDDMLAKLAEIVLLLA